MPRNVEVFPSFQALTSAKQEKIGALSSSNERSLSVILRVRVLIRDTAAERPCDEP